MRGYLKVECANNEVQCKARIEEAGILDRYQILSVVCDALEIDDVLLYAFVTMGRGIVKKGAEQTMIDLSKLGGVEE